VTAVEPTTEPTTEPTDNRSRRDVLCGLMVALLAPGALVACGDSNSSGSSGSTPGGSSGTGAASGTGTKLAALSDVPQGGGLVVDKPGGGKLVLTRASGDVVKAFNASCKHKGTIVNAPQAGIITCPAHGSQYDAATGALKKGPATAGLDPVSVKVDGTNIVMA
jgi:cytochrome b6-f complex iron-sulfur subunit